MTTINEKLFRSAIKEICQAIATNRKDYVINNLRCCISFLNCLQIDEQNREKLLNSVKIIKNKLEQKGVRVKSVYNDLSSLLDDLNN